MKIKTCPYCDSVMAKKHRCDVCNSFVWKPSEVEGNYKMQETYDESWPQQSNSVQNQKDTSKKASPKKASPKKAVQKESGKGKKAAVVIFWLCAALIVLAGFIESDTGQEIKWAVEDFFEELSDGSKTPETEDVLAFEETYDWYNIDVENPKENFENGIWQYESGGEVTAEEVISKGEECTEKVHFPIPKDTVISELTAYAKNVLKVPEVDITVSDMPSANYVYHTGSYESTNFEQYTHIHFGESSAVISVDYDTVSKNLHSISMMEVSRDKVPEVIKLFVNIVDGEVSESFIDECLNFGDDTYTFTYGDGYRIYVSEETDDSYFVMMSGSESEY